MTNKNGLIGKVAGLGYCINLHTLEVNEDLNVRIDKIIKTILGIIELPPLKMNRNKFLNFNSKDFGGSGEKVYGEVNDSTILIKDFYKKGFWGLMIHVKSSRNIVSDSFYIRCRYNISNLSELLHTSDSLVKRYLPESEVKIMNDYGNISEGVLTNNELLLLSLNKGSKVKDIYYPHTVIKSLLDIPGFRADNRERELAANKRNPLSIQRNFYLRETDADFLFDDPKIDKEDVYYILDESLLSYMRAE